MRKVGIGLVMGLATTGVAMAEEKGAWQGEAELGYVATSGNTETQSVSAKAKAKTQRDKWLHKLGIEALRTEDEVATTAEKYAAKGQTNYSYSDTRYAWVSVAYEDDRFSGYEYQASEAVGYGMRVLNKETMTLDLEFGPGARQTKLVSSGESDSEAVFRLAADYQWDVSETAHFSEELGSEIGEDVTISKSVTGLKSQVNGSLAMKITYTVKHTSEVPLGVEKTDTETGITLVYSF